MDGVNIKNLARVRRDRQLQVMYRFFAFDTAPHYRLASPDQFRHGRHHLAKFAEVGGHHIRCISRNVNACCNIVKMPFILSYSIT
ncbi:hypothetical protein SeMB42_g04624 [Synchytrium endobioticum]|uniref:Uncharacterized protein n=1 Tax=Synchytrium endobioticum TaxID=286115 RepID=A0A507CWX8_9FUNG|nr:hypothetical protein SeMB42_g04624 [Synchytrium endobioticum]